MRSLPIDLDELAEAMDHSDLAEHESYLDTQAGKVICIMKEFMDEEDEEEDEADDEDENLPEWQRDAIAKARMVRHDTADRFILIPTNDSSDAYRLMEQFIHSIQDERPKDLLSRAIAGKGAFRRFKDTLTEFPILRQQWFNFEAAKKREAAAEWLESIGLRSTWSPPQR